MTQEILLLKIHNAIDRDKKSYYEAVQGNWKINVKRIPNIKYVIGIYHKKVVCAFIPDKWETVVEGPEIGRKRFEGREAPEKFLEEISTYNDELLKRFGTGSALAYIPLSEIENKYLSEFN